MICIYIYKSGGTGEEEEEEEEGSTIAAWGNTPREWCPTLS